MMSRLVQIAVALSILSLSGAAMATSPTPTFTLLDSDPDASIQVRRYPAMIYAVTTVETSDYRQAGNLGFQRLAGYIFGDNGRLENIGMTSPVVRNPAPGRTGPALQRGNATGGWFMAFIMPPRYTLETLPAPRDPRITLTQIPERHVIALRFSGWASDADLTTRGAALLAWAKKHGHTPRGTPTLAVYDSPRVPGERRRNEIQLVIDPPKTP